METYLGTILAFGFSYAPQGWAICNGALISITQNTALYSLLGTYYGGDGRNTFGIPDLQGRVIIGQGSGAGLTPRTIGEKAGYEYVGLTVNQLPVHNHTAQFTGTSVTIKANSAPATAATPSTRANAIGAITSGYLYNNTAPTIDLNVAGTSEGNVEVSNVGGNDGHYNLQPYTVLNYCIATQGLYPPRQ